MTVETSCYVCGKEGLCINGLCPDCTMKELFEPGRAFAATFGSLPGQAAPFTAGTRVRLKAVFPHDEGFAIGDIGTVQKSTDGYGVCFDRAPYLTIAQPELGRKIWEYVEALEGEGE